MAYSATRSCHSNNHYHVVVALCFLLVHNFSTAVAITLGDEILQFLPAGGYNRIVYATDNYVVTCFPPDNTTVVRVTWRGPKKEIKERTGRIHVEENQYRPNGIDLFIEGLTIRDQGIYECSAIIEGASVSKSFNLKVYKKIVFEDAPDVQHITEGLNQNVRCIATAVPVPKISWKINGSIPIQDNKHFPDIEKGLSIRNVSREDAGIYTCRATQADDYVSNFEEININVIVKYKPEWRLPILVIAYAYIGGVVNLTCEADGEPSPVYNWMQDDNPIVESQYIRVHDFKRKSILEIHVRNITDFGEYTCSASNSEGFTERSIELREGVKPAIPKIEVVNFSTRNIFLDISDNTDGELHVTGYTIEYRTETQTWNDSKKEEVHVKNGNDGPEAQYVLANLEPSTSYILRVAARNAVGLSDYTADIVQKTDKEPAPQADFDTASDSVRITTVLTIVVCLPLFAYVL